MDNEAYWKSRLSNFLSSHKFSSVVEADSAGDDKKSLFAIENPWNDSSLRLDLSTGGDGLCETLNNILLPERFSAIWHKDTQNLEVIYQAFPLAPSLKDLPDRAFIFRYDGRSYECEYSDSSERLNVISKSFEAVQSTQTNYRNLQSYSSYHEFKLEPNAVDFVEACRPLSFWIKNIAFHSDKMVNIISHLNFYMSYYDRKSPIVVIHPPKIKKSTVSVKRFIADTFPKNITARSLDDNLLHYWEAASQGDPGRRFGYYYRVIEYCASFFIDQINRSAMKRALSAPNALDDIDRISDEVMSISARMKMDERPRMEAMLKEYVGVKCMWAAIEQNKQYFCNEQVFAGGFKIPSIISENSTIETYTPSAYPQFVGCVRNIRNALSHGKDQKTQSVIIPTTHNLALLQPWVVFISDVAGDLILNRP